MNASPIENNLAAGRYQAFRRYTDLAAAIHLLQAKQITLLNPDNWDDKNDAYFMSEYKRLIGAKSVLAICFADGDETYHHWSVFSRGSNGICIEFQKEDLLEGLIGQTGVRHGKVTYRKISTLKRRKIIDARDLPFLKRKPYEPEHEYRVIYSSHASADESVSFSIDIQWIRRITLSPWMPVALQSSIKSVLRSIQGCNKVKIVRSTLVGNDEWKSLTSLARPLRQSDR